MGNSSARVMAMFVMFWAGSSVVEPLEAQTRGDRFELFGTVTTNLGEPAPFDTLVKIDPQTGAQTPAGPGGGVIGVNQVDADPATGMLFGTDFSTPGVIYRIDPATGIASVEAQVAAGVTAVAFAPNGTLYGIDGDFSTGYVLGRIDLSAQTFTPVMRLQLGVRVDAIDFSPNGLLYAVYVQPDTSEQWLVALDIHDQLVVTQTALGTPAVGDMDYAVDGFIYHSNYSQGLFRLDPENPVPQLVGFGDIGAAGGLASVSSVAGNRVEIDIRPGAFPNVINPCSAGVVPVAILSTRWLDASTIDPTTIKLNDASPRTAGQSGRTAALADVDGDGDRDLLIHVFTADLGVRVGDARITLTGQTFDGAQIVGTDTIQLVGSTSAGRGLGQATCPD